MNFNACLQLLASSDLLFRDVLSLCQGQVSGGPAVHPHQNFCSLPPLPREMFILLRMSFAILGSNKNLKLF